MSTRKPSLATIAVLCALAVGSQLPRPAAAADGGPVVSLESLLREMLDRGAVAQLPSPAFALRQASSHDRRKKDPADAEAWHSNVDYGQFLRTESNQGRQEWVIMDDQGPGAIVRFWTPLAPEKDNQVIRFYFDGSPSPALALKFNELLCGQGFVRPPLAFTAWNESNLANQLKPEYRSRRGVAGDLYLPIPFAKSCKITLDSVPFYYVINYRIYRPETTVQTFNLAGFEAVKDTLELAAKSLLRNHPSPADGEHRVQRKLEPGQELPLDLPAASSVEEIRLRIDPKAAPQALRSLILEAEFDGEMTAWCPIGEFFGAGVRLNPVDDWWRTVKADGTLTARWIMPYRHSGRLKLKNTGQSSMAVDLVVRCSPYRWTDRSLHFHAAWHCQLDMKTRPMRDWNYLAVDGRGRYVGDTLTVFSPVKAWYGEGDERIYYDGAKLPAHIGTGTEDYYGYAWGMAGHFSSPFISMPQRDYAGQDDWRGYTTTSRLRLLDNIPFQTGLRHDMEIWNWADTQVDYAVATFWYARPGARHNREPQAKEAAVAVREVPGEFRVRGATECESATIAAHSPGLQIGTQDSGLTQGQWSGGRQLFVQATKPGDFVELAIPAADDHPCRVTLYATKSYDYGILRFTINGVAGKEFDGYNDQPIASGPIDLGTFSPKDKKLRLRAVVVGANAASRGGRYYFGLDCVAAKQ